MYLTVQCNKWCLLGGYGNILTRTPYGPGLIIRYTLLLLLPSGPKPSLNKHSIKTALCGWFKKELITQFKLSFPIVS